MPILYKLMRSYLFLIHRFTDSILYLPFISKLESILLIISENDIIYPVD